MSILVETKRLYMRAFVESDAAALFEMDADPEVHKYLGNKPKKNIQEAVNDIRHIQAQYGENGIGRWAVIDKKTDAFVGWSGLKYEQNLRKNNAYYDLGYRFKRMYWGQGIATETARASLRYGFHKMGLSQICAAAHHQNRASNKVLRKIGFRFVETFLYEDIPCHWYVLDKTDWENLPFVASS